MLPDPDDRLDDEIRHHIVERADHLVSQGWDREAALAEARRRFGDVDRFRRELRGIDRWSRVTGRLRGVLKAWASDLRHALRGMRANPPFTFSVIATLALGIGAATSIFAVADALLLRPLPYADADRWVRVHQLDDRDREVGGIPPGRLEVWRNEASAVSDAWIAYLWNALARSDGDMAETLDVLAVTPDAVRLLGIPLVLGRGFTPDDGAAGAPAVGLLSERYWIRLGADPSVIGTTVRVEGRPLTVVGVLEDGWKFPPDGREIDLWVPIRRDLTYLDRSASWYAGTWMRLVEGSVLPTAQERLDGVAEALAGERPDERIWRIRLAAAGDERARPEVRQAVALLGATVATLFVIALVNAVNLLVVRTAARARELALRLALGASRGQLVRQLAAEGVVLGLLAGAAAVVVAALAARTVGALLPETVAYYSPYAVSVEGRTLLFAFLTALTTGVALGLIPGATVYRGAAGHTSLTGRPGDGRAGGRRLRTVLVVTQVALSMSLLAVAGVLTHSVVRLLSVDPGFRTQQMVIADLQPSPLRYPTGADRADFVERLEAALEARPEIGEVALSTIRRGTANPLEAEDGSVAGGGDGPSLVPHVAVSPDYVETVGLTLVEGRALEAGDIGTANAVVDRDLARFLWGRGGALGRRFRLGEGEWLTVVGVVDELMLLGRDERRGPHQFLLPRDPESSSSYVELLIRTTGPADAAIGAFQRTLHDLDPQQSYYRARSATDWLNVPEAEPRFVAVLMGSLASVAVALAAVGLFGLLAYSVAQRRRELGVRLALGAVPAGLTGMVIRDGLLVATVGIVAGLGLAAVSVRIVEGLLYGVAPRDPLALALASGLLAAVSVVASLLPARRAMRVDPVEVLKSS